MDPDPDPEGDKEGEGGLGGNEGIGSADDANKKDAAWSFVSFSLEKETKEPWPPPLLYLREVMLDLNPCQFVQTAKHKGDNNK